MKSEIKGGRLEVRGPDGGLKYSIPLDKLTRVDDFTEAIKQFPNISEIYISPTEFRDYIPVFIQYDKNLNRQDRPAVRDRLLRDAYSYIEKSILHGRDIRVYEDIPFSDFTTVEALFFQGFSITIQVGRPGSWCPCSITWLSPPDGAKAILAF